MKTKIVAVTCSAFIALLACSALIYAQELKPIKLPEVQKDGGKTLMQALSLRKTTREFSSEKIPMQVLSNMLWAAWGINRPETGGRTAPSAINWQEIKIYVAMQEGLFIFDAKAHVLNPVLAQDIRAATGLQDFVKDVPVNLIYVADFSNITASEQDKVFYSAADTGFISQNVYLYCASEGLVTGVRNLVDKPALAKTMNLKPEQRVILTQSVGYPKK
ncbi:MAG: nitroreductase family protein [Sedimentisphaerales bacterium]|nr:nitroreductase family protein [Sedimentisphaerales bacterium]